VHEMSPRKMPLLCFFFAALLSFCTSCVSPESPGLEFRFSFSDFQGQPHYQGNVQLAVGAKLTVILCSNPTTGYQWSNFAQINDQSVLRQTDHHYLPPAGGQAGAPGQEVWTFRTLRKGTCTIYLEYSRPWEGGEKGTWTFLLTVAVL
jgi:predicted secreted protein